MAQMSEKAKRFVEEYLIDLNATQAAIRAGYSARSAGNTGSRLLKQSAVREAVEKAQAERSRRTGVNTDRVLMELAKLAFVNPVDLMDLEEGKTLSGADPDDLACIASFRVKYDRGEVAEREIKLCDKTKALELCGKHLGMFVDRKEITDKEGRPFSVQIRVVE